MSPEDSILAFARDFSENDPAIVARVQEMSANPPTDIETIGFYGAEDYPARHRLFLATVNLLDVEEKLWAVEDKYTTEIFALWQDAGIIDVKTLPATAKSVFGPLIDESLAPAGEAAARAYRDLVWSQYAQATEELERHIAEHGKTLVSIDATDGDTMLFALVAPEIVAKWRDRALSEHDGYHAGVRAPMWDRFWAHLSYSARGMIADEDRKGVPPGTRQRVEAIPLAE